jgi:RNA polymerase sigma-70 factor (ECF subfamily)
VTAAQALLSSIVQVQGPHLAKFFERRIPDACDVQDLVQEVYLRVLKLERPDLIRNPRAYVFRVAANIAREYWLKCAARPPHVEFEDAPGADASMDDSHCEALARLEQLALMLGDLPPKVGAALIWAHRDGHTYKEIAKRLSVSKNRVKKYLARAIAHCRERAAAEATAGF